MRRNKPVEPQHKPTLPVVAATFTRGELSATVWPSFVGLAESTTENVLRESIGDADYDRGQIDWVRKDTGEITGHGRVHIPKGVYTYVIFATGPVEAVVGVRKLEHPIVVDRPGFADISPIRNKELLPRGSA